MKKAVSIISTILMILIIIASSLVVYKDVCYFEAVVVGDSMKTTLYEGDIALVKYIKYVKKLNRGDIVVFEKGVAGTDDYEVVKRVIGIPGDHVKIDKSNNCVYVNNKLYVETYLNNAYSKYTSLRGNVDNYDVILDEEDYFVLGDNREVSLDSRYYGAISINQIKGVLKVVYAHASFSSKTNDYTNKKLITWRFY